jgi:hypothetical protein
MVNYGYLLFNEMVSYGRNCGISMGYGMAVEHYSKCMGEKTMGYP